jgi:hypothetical protein
MKSFAGIVQILGLLGLSSLAQPVSAAVVHPETGDTTGADFSVQGEYSGQVGSPSGRPTDLAAQVVALGDGTFRVVFFPGGLPGDGWNGTGRFAAEGMTGEGGTRIVGDDFNGVLIGDTLKGTAEAGGDFTLVKRHRISPTLGLAPPAQAIVLSTDASLTDWDNASIGTTGYFEPLNREAVTRNAYSDFSLHLEFRLPYLPYSVGQARANSGIRFMDTTYLFAEIQILDSFAGDTGSNESGGIEGLFPSTVMANYPPMAWQTFDIQLSTPDATDTSNTGEARMTVWQNGILIHSDRRIAFMGAAVRIALQSLDPYGAFRNIWILEGNDRYPFLPGAALRPKPNTRQPASTPKLRFGSEQVGRGHGVFVDVPGFNGSYRPNGTRILQNPKRP